METKFIKLGSIYIDLLKVKYISKQELDLNSDVIRGWTVVYKNEKFQITHSEYETLVDALKKHYGDELVVTDQFVILKKDIMYCNTRAEFVEYEVRTIKDDAGVDAEYVKEHSNYGYETKRKRVYILTTEHRTFHMKKRTLLQLQEQL